TPLASAPPPHPPLAPAPPPPPPPAPAPPPPPMLDLSMVRYSPLRLRDASRLATPPPRHRAGAGAERGRARSARGGEAEGGGGGGEKQGGTTDGAHARPEDLGFPRGQERCRRT